MIQLVAAMDLDGVIGRDGGLPWKQPADMKHFRELTIGGMVIVGHTTFQGIGVLPKRETLVLSRSRMISREATPEDPRRAWSRASLGAAIEDARSFTKGPVSVIGGAEIYRAFLPHVDRLELTVMETRTAGDTWFPALRAEEWRVAAIETIEPDEKNPLRMHFVSLDRNGHVERSIQEGNLPPGWLETTFLLGRTVVRQPRS